ncbi:hypothetical protein [Virgibacillus ihumii]|uniref:hypothetical protein n=1 Tax=Virgibacillus ihumii TaxID=2686091 RepID=UPI00157DE2F7|nr:hypothetical protein [Virgibacillus ihumii]
MDKKLLISIILGLVVIAGLLDVKYQGLFYRMLPYRIQKKLAEVFQHEQCYCRCGCSEN